MPRAGRDDGHSLRTGQEPGTPPLTGPSTLPPGARPLRVVHVTPSYPPCVGGAERLTQEISERLAARGHQVTVLTTNCATQRDFGSEGGAGLPSSEMLRGVRVLRTNPAGGPLRAAHEWWLRQRGGYRTTRWVLGPDMDFLIGRPSGPAMVRPVLRAEADLLASFNWHYGLVYWAALAARWRALPHVAVPVLHIDQAWAARAAYPPLLRRAAAAIALTEPEARFLRDSGARDTVVAGGGVDPARYDQRDGAALRSRYALDRRPIVGFIGRQDRLKGVPTLIRAMEIVWNGRPDALLLLAGQRAHRDQATSDALAALDPAQRTNVLLLDDFADEDGPSILDACDVVAQPSTEEAFGLVLLEAWVCGKPVIGADIAATRSLIDPGVDGWIVPLDDAESLAGRIQGLLADPGARMEFGRRGRAKVLSRYSWDRMTDIWEATYRSVLQAHPFRR